VSLHPATLLVAWGGFVVVLQSLAITGLAWAAAAVLPLSLFLARRRSLLLIRRARWLLLSIAVLFAFATPGERLAEPFGGLGVTHDGLKLALEHVLRLTLLLASLALLHERLGNEGLIGGLHWLMAPLAGQRELRERIVVRLLLVLDYVESEPKGGWRGWLQGEASGPERLSLAVGPVGYLDWAAMAILAAAALWWWS